MRGAYRVVQRLWRLLPLSLRRRLWLVSGERVRHAFVRQRLPRPRATIPNEVDLPVVVVGLFRTANGIGEAARSTYRSLCAVGLSPVAVDVSAHFAPVDLDTEIPLSPMPVHAKHGIVILQLNAPEVIAGLLHIGLSRNHDWYIVGYWAWELPTFPRGWDIAFQYISELWAISSYTKSALEKHRAAPSIHAIPHSIVVPDTVQPDRAAFGLSEDETIFLTMADSMSSLERKNPFGAIAAFRAAFKEGEPTRLIVKTRNLVTNPDAHKALFDSIGGDKRVTVVDQSLSDDARWKLLASCDAMVSLHRAEGFGLPIAEAMAIGKPVITTGWSGNCDFVSDDTAFVIQAELVKLRDQFRRYRDPRAHWAEPSLKQATHAIRMVFADPAGAALMGERARVAIAKQLSPLAVGRRMVARLHAKRLR